MNLKAASLRLVNEKTNDLELVASHLLSKKYLEKGQLTADKSIPEVLRGNTVFIKDVATSENIQYRDEAIKEGIVSMLSVPIFVKEYVIGETRLYAAEQRHYDREEIEFILALAEIGGIAITNTTFYQRLKNDIKFWESTLFYLNEG